MKINKKNTISIRLMLSNPIHFLSFGFGVGLLKPGPGTWGSLMGVGLYLGLNTISFISTNWMVGLFLFIALFLIGVVCCQKTGLALGVDDHGAIVWDEIVAMLLVCYFVEASFLGYLGGFLLFRAFDIFKPQPIAWLDERLKGGLGVMLDDLVAAIFTIVIYQSAHWFFTLIVK